MTAGTCINLPGGVVRGCVFQLAAIAHFSGWM